jgi:hypothetical protein
MEVNDEAISAIGTAFVLCSMGLAIDVPKTPTDATRVTSIPIGEFVRTYATNEIRAEDLYEGKNVTIKGAVVRVIHSRYALSEIANGVVSKDGTYVVELKGEELGPSTISAKFYFDKSERAKLAELRAGQEVIIQGLCNRPAFDRRQFQKDFVEIPIWQCKLIQGK